MELYIFDSSLKFIGILDIFTSFRKVRRYYANGGFELQCPLNQNTLNLLKQDNVILIKGDREANYIETVKYNIAENGQEVITVNGKDLGSYFNRRINWGRIDFKGTYENLMRKLVKDNAITPTDTKRKIPHLILGDLKGHTEQVNYQNSFGGLFEQLQYLSNASNLGFRNLLDIKNKNIIFDIYKGVDRTVNNGKIVPCIFSRSFENILQQDYFDSVNNYKNTCLIAGAGEGENRKLTAIENSGGLNRYEFFVDARDITDETVQSAEYEKLLRQRGYEKLSECRKVQTLSGKINLQGNNRYKTDFDLGDIVTIKDKKWGVMKNAMITEIEEIYEESGVDINVTFGNPIPTLIDKIKQMKN